jgi:hypothetical protein
MGMVSRSGLTVQNMKGNGRTTKLAVKENWYMLMEIFMKVNGKMIKLTEKGVTNMLMVPHMLENGRMINNMEAEQRHGLMELNTRVNTLKAKNMAREL